MFALLTYAFQLRRSVSIPPLTGVGVATTVSPAFAPVTLTVPIVPQLPNVIFGASMEVVADRCLVITVPEPIANVLADAVPLIVVVMLDRPMLIAEALLVPILILAAPPASMESGNTPVD